MAISDNSEPFPRIAIIGAGVSGILAAIRLRQSGLQEFTVFEKATGVGGTWLQNSYPGLYCDVPIYNYVYSFSPSSRWTHRFASGGDILGYYRDMVKRYRVEKHIRLNSEIAAAEWREGAWRLTTVAAETLCFDIVISAVGRLNQPAYPDLPGLSSFAGPVFHSAEWRHDISFAGKTVGLIGTGSTGVQILSTLSGSAKLVNLFQRTPQWVTPSPNTPMPLPLRLLLRVFPPAVGWYRRKQEQWLIKLGKQFLAGTAPLADMARAGLDRIADPELKAKLTPSYEPGCKRLVSSPDYHEVVQRPNVAITTEAIDHVTASGIVTADGRLHALDALVLATGFRAAAFLQPMAVTGADGVTLDTLWAETNVNYKSVAIPHMFNFFTLNGPYTPVGASSYIPVAEAQVGYVMQCIRHIVRRRVAIAPREDRTRRLFDAVRDKARQTVWSSGCDSWLLDKTGVPMVNPQALDETRIDLAALDLDDYEQIALREARDARQAA